MDNNVTFTGSWDSEEESQVRALLDSVFADYPGVSIECSYRSGGNRVPYQAQVTYQGRRQSAVAYGPAALVENIRYCLPVLSS